MTIGKKLFDEIEASDVQEIATSCGACKMQIYQGTKKDSVTPVSLLARAYARFEFEEVT